MSGPVNPGFNDTNQGMNQGNVMGAPINNPPTHMAGPTTTVPRGNAPTGGFPTPGGHTGPVPSRPVPGGFNPHASGDGFPKPGPVHGNVPGPQKGGFGGPPPTHGGPSFPPKTGVIPNMSAPVKEEPKEKGGIPPQFGPVLETVQRGLETLEEIDVCNFSYSLN